MNIVTLPFGIKIATESGNASLVMSGLAEELKADETDAVGQAAVDALESFLLALAAEGVNLTQPGVKRALETSVEAIANQLD